MPKKPGGHSGFRPLDQLNGSDTTHGTSWPLQYEHSRGQNVNRGRPVSPKRQKLDHEITWREFGEKKDSGRPPIRYRGKGRGTARLNAQPQHRRLSQFGGQPEHRKLENILAPSSKYKQNRSESWNSQGASSDLFSPLLKAAQTTDDAMTISDDESTNRSLDLKQGRSQPAGLVSLLSELESIPSPPRGGKSRPRSPPNPPNPQTTSSYFPPQPSKTQTRVSPKPERTTPVPPDLPAVHITRQANDGLPSKSQTNKGRLASIVKPQPTEDQMEIDSSIDELAYQTASLSTSKRRNDDKTPPPPEDDEYAMPESPLTALPSYAADIPATEFVATVKQPGAPRVKSKQRAVATKRLGITRSPWPLLGLNFGRGWIREPSLMMKFDDSARHFSFRGGGRPIPCYLLLDKIQSIQMSNDPSCRLVRVSFPRDTTNKHPPSADLEFIAYHELLSWFELLDVNISRLRIQKRSA